MKTLTDIDRLLEETMRGISTAAEKRNLAGITALTKRASELELMRKTISGIEERLKGFCMPAEQSSEQKPVGIEPKEVLRTLPIEVSQGMINQNLLTLTEHVKRGKIQVGEELLVETIPSEERFLTELVRNGNKLRERGGIARFYRDAGVRSGDFVVLFETKSRRWKLRKAEAGEFKSRLDMLLSI